MSTYDSTTSLLGIPAEDLCARLSTSMPGLEPKNPLKDGGLGLQTLIEVGNLPRANSLLEVASAQALQHNRQADLLTCRLLQGLLYMTGGNRRGARQDLDKAMRIAVNTAMDAPAQRLLSYVGLEVSLSWRDSPEIHAFLTRLQEIPESDHTELLEIRRRLWTAEWSVRSRNLILAEKLLDPVPVVIDHNAAGESTWRALWLRSEIARARSDTTEAKSYLQEAIAVVDVLSRQLPEVLREGYLSTHVSRRLHERLNKIEQMAKGSKNAAEDSAEKSSEEDTATATKPFLRVVSQILESIAALNRHANLGALMDFIIDAMLRFTGARRGMMALVHDGEVSIQRGRHIKGRPLKPAELQLSSTVASQVAKGAEPVLIADASLDSMLSKMDSVISYGIRSVLCVPLTLEGKRCGAIYLDNAERAGAFSQRMLDTMIVLGAHAALAIEHARLLAKVTRDSLTKTYTLAFLKAQMASALTLAQRHSRSCGLLMIDLDNFKLVNDTYGHAFGDRVLKETASGMRAIIGQQSGSSAQVLPDGADVLGIPGASLARLGNDRFALFLPDAGATEMSNMADRLLKCLWDTRIVHQGSEVSISASIGGACFPDHGETTEELLRRAEVMLHQAKRDGRNRIYLAGDEADRQQVGVGDEKIDALLLNHEGRLALAMVSRMVPHCDNLRRALGLALQQMASAVGADDGLLQLRGESLDSDLIMAIRPTLSVPGPLEQPLAFDIIDQVRSDETPVLLADLASETDDERRKSAKALGVHSAMGIPLRPTDGCRGGVYLALTDKARRFTANDMRLLQLFAEQVAPLLALSLALDQARDKRGH